MKFPSCTEMPPMKVEARDLGLHLGKRHTGGGLRRRRVGRNSRKPIGAAITVRIPRTKKISQACFSYARFSLTADQLSAAGALPPKTR